MAVARLLPDEVWNQLDPRAGRLSRRGRRGVLCVVAAAVVALGLAVVAAVTGAIEPRVSGSLSEFRFDTTTHSLVLRVRIDNAGSTDLHVHALTTEDSRYEVTAASTPFVVAGHSSRVVRIAVLVRSCAEVTPTDAIPLGITVAHWWGSRDQALLSAYDTPFTGFAAQTACHPDPS